MAVVERPSYCCWLRGSTLNSFLREVWSLSTGRFGESFLPLLYIYPLNPISILMGCNIAGKFSWQVSYEYDRKVKTLRWHVYSNPPKFKSIEITGCFFEHWISCCWRKHATTTFVFALELDQPPGCWRLHCLTLLYDNHFELSKFQNLVVLYLLWTTQSM